MAKNYLSSSIIKETIERNKRIVGTLEKYEAERSLITFHRMDPLLLPWSKPLQHVSTLVRQFLFDFIIIMEDCVLLGYALNSNIDELQENKKVFVITLLGFKLVGLILKCVYCR